jgi:hypothetical protein
VRKRRIVLVETKHDRSLTEAWKSRRGLVIKAGMKEQAIPSGCEIPAIFRLARRYHCGAQGLMLSSNKLELAAEG